MRVFSTSALIVLAAGILVAVPGTPAYAATLPTGAQSLESVNFPGRYIRHANYLGQLDQVTSASPAQTKLDATFTIVNGLASPACYSFQTKSGLFLRHRDWRVRVELNTGDATFRADATFCSLQGSVAGSISLASYNYPSHRIRHRDYALWLDTYQDTVLFRADSSFRTTAPWVPKTNKGPVIPGLFADPHVAVFNGRYYLYPTTDGYSGWSGTYYKAFSSPDLVNWPTTVSSSITVRTCRGPTIRPGLPPSWPPTAATTFTSAAVWPVATPPSTSAWPCPTRPIVPTL